MERFDHLFGGIEWTVELAFPDLPYALINVSVDAARRCQCDFPFHQLRLDQITTFSFARSRGDDGRVTCPLGLTLASDM